MNTQFVLLLTFVAVCIGTPTRKFEGADAITLEPFDFEAFGKSYTATGFIKTGHLLHQLCSPWILKPKNVYQFDRSPNLVI